MKVLHIVPWVGHGGVERRRALLARQLSSSVDQSLACLTAREPIRSELEAAKCRVYPIGGSSGRFDARAAIRLARLVRQLRPDIVHGAVFEGTTLAILGGLAGRTRIIIEETSCPDTMRSRTADALQHAYVRIADRIVSVSPAVTDYLRRRVHPPPHKLIEIANGIEEPELPDESVINQERERLQLRDAQVIGAVGRFFDRVKRYSMLIDTLAILRQTTPVKLLLVGDGPDMSMLRAKASAMGVEDDVIFTGYRRDVGTMLALMDIFVIGSTSESFSLVAAEAMLSGLPVVCVRTGGLPSVLGDAGVLLPRPAGAEEFAAACADLLRDVGRRTQLGEAARLRAQLRFGAQRYASDVESLYNAVLCD